MGTKSRAPYKYANKYEMRNVHATGISKPESKVRVFYIDITTDVWYRKCILQES